MKPFRLSVLAPILACVVVLSAHAPSARAEAIPLSGATFSLVGNGSAEMAFELPWSGEDAATVSATLRYGTDAESLPGSIVRPNVAESGTIPLSGLLPDTTYYAQLTLDNGTDTAQTEVLSVQTVKQRGASTLSSANRVDASKWTSPAASSSGNLLAGILPAIESGTIGNNANGSNLTDGTIATNTGDARMASVDNASGSTTLRWEFGRSVNLGSVNIYSWWSDTRAVINVDAIETRDADGVWSRLPDSRFGAGSANAANRACFRPETDGDALASGITALRICFTNSNANGGYSGWRAYREVEAIEFAGSVGREFLVETLLSEGTALSASLAFDAFDCDTRLFAALGNDWASGSSTNGWDSIVDCGLVLRGATSAAAVADNAAGYRFVRYFLFPQEGPSFPLPSATLDTTLAETAGTAPVLVPLSVDSPSVGAARVQVGLLAAGQGAAGADLSLVYGHDGFLYTNAVASADDAIGNRIVSLPCLKPGARYTFRAVAVNSLGERTESAPVELDVTPDKFSEPIAAAPSWKNGRWDTEGLSASTENNLVLHYSSGNLYDGNLATAASISSGASYSYSFGAPMSISEFRTYTDGTGGRYEIHVAKLEVEKLDGSRVTLFEGSHKNSTGNAKNYAFFRSEDGRPLAIDVVGFTVSFGTQMNGYCHYSEIEILGGPGISVPLTVESILLDGRDAIVTVSRPDSTLGIPFAVYALQGTSNHGVAAADWAADKGSVKVGRLDADASSLEFRFPLADGASLVRFRAVSLEDDGFTESGAELWSATQVVGETPRYESPVPSVAASSVRSVGPASVSVAANVQSLGAGATGAVALLRTSAVAGEWAGETAASFVQGAFPGLGEFLFAGLSPSTPYFAQFGVSNSLGEVAWAPETLSFTTPSRDSISATATSAAVSAIGCETIFDFTTSGSLTVSRPGWARLLLVGGGGGGGGQVGGGGGGGGFVETNLYLEAGTYAVTVGAGGKGGTSNSAGGRGGDTSIALEGGLSLVAYGGGGGDEWDNQRPQGANFGSGGGGANNRAGFAGTAGQGNAGGQGDDYCGGGGGGAGGPGAHRDFNNNFQNIGRGGNGGDGLPSAITGETIHYAAGGGGGSQSSDVNLAGLGGLGGGGRGHDPNNVRAPHDGTDGLGGGGGGGSNNSQFGGRGGHGRAIVRFLPAPSRAANPALSIVDIRPGNATAEADVRIAATGRESSGSLTLRYGADPAALDHETLLSPSATVGEWTYSLGALRSGQPYYAQAVLTLAGGATALSAVHSFRTLVGDDSGVDSAAPVLADVGLAVNHADRTVIRGRVRGEGVSLSLFVGTSEGTMKPVPSTVEWTDGTDADGYSGFALSTSEPLAPSTLYHWVVQADSEGGCDRSDPGVFTTPQVKGEILAGWLIGQYPVSSSQGYIRFQFAAKALGAGENWVLLKLAEGDCDDATVSGGDVFARWPIDEEARILPLDYVYDYADIDPTKTYTFAFVMSNVYEGVSYVTGVSRGQTHTFKYTDSSTYTWTGAGEADATGAKAWEDPANWSGSKPACSLGYPDNGSIAVFPANTTARISVACSHNVNNVRLDQNGLDLTFVRAADATETLPRLLSDNTANPGESRKVVLTVDGMRLQWNQNGANFQFGPESRISVVNGGYLYIGGQDNCGAYFRRDGIVVRVENGSTLHCYGQLFLGATAEILLDDSTLLCDNLYLGNGVTGGTIRFRGSSPAFTAGQGNGHAYFYQQGATPSRFVFEVPEGGYAQAPVWHYDIHGSQEMCTTVSAGILVEIATNSPALASAESVTTRLVDDYYGINASAFSLVSSNAADHLGWKYGRNGVSHRSLALDEPLAAGDKPTSLWVTIGGSGDAAEPAISSVGVSDLGATSATIDVFCSIPAGSEPVAFSAVLSGGAPEEDTLAGSQLRSFRFEDLSPSTEYAFEISLGSASTNFSFRTLGADSRVVVGAVTGATKTEAYGPYTLYVFDDPDSAASLEIAEGGPAEVLVVGGGGSGGTGWSARSNAGGSGGGAGGFLHLTNLYLAPGTYPIAVGPGGARVTADNVSGNPGGDSRFGDWVAYGGGRGANYGSVGGDGASGGGGGGQSGKAAGAAFAVQQGFAGGKGWPSANESAGGGGGGAGGAGGVPPSASEGGAGGAGMVCRITGTETMYATGGSGSGNSLGKVPVGYGCYGSGGHGANRQKGNDSAEAGRAGVVIVRVLTTALSSDVPSLSVDPTARATDCTTAALGWELFSIGAGADNATATFVWTYPGESAEHVSPVAANLVAAGVRVDTVEGLPPGRAIVGRIRVENNLGESALSSEIAFATVPESSSDVSPYAGLIQARRSNASWFTGDWDIEGDASAVRIPSGPAALLHGSNVSPATWTDADGGSHKWGDSTTFGYVGYMYFEKKTYKFAGGMDDNGQLRIFADDARTEPLFSHTMNGNGFYVGSWACPDKGWYPIEVRAGNGSGGAGPYGTNRRFLFNDEGVTGEGNAAWRAVEDPGDGSLLRIARVNGTPILVSSALVRGTDLLLTCVARTESEAALTAFFGGSYGADDPSAWGASVPLSAVLPGTEGTVFQVLVPGAAGARYVRLLGDADGGEAIWSTTFLVEDAASESAAPILAVAGDATGGEGLGTQGLSILSVGSGAASCDVFAAYGLSPDALAYTNLVLRDAVAGPATATIVGLKPARTYYARFHAVNDEGETSEPTAIVSFTTRSDEGENHPGWDGGKSDRARAISIVNETATGCDLSFGPCDENWTNDLYVAFAATPGDSKSTNGWTRIIKLSDSILTPATTSWHYDYPATWRTVDGAMMFFFGLEEAASKSACKSPADYYVQDGLIECFDAEWNAGVEEGQDYTVSHWADLVSGTQYPIDSNLAWDSDKECLKIVTGGKHFAFTPSPFGLGEYSIQVFSPNHNSGAILDASDDGLWLTFNGALKCWRNTGSRPSHNQWATGKTLTVVSAQTFYGYRQNGQWAKQTHTLGTGKHNACIGVGGWDDPGQSNLEVKSIRVYDRELTDEEIAANELVDDIRWNGAEGTLPAVGVRKEPGLNVYSSSDTVVFTGGDPAAPSVGSVAVSGLETGDTVTVSGTVLASDLPVSVVIEYYGTETEGAPLRTLAATLDGATFSAVLENCRPGLPNHFRVVATDASGRLDATPVRSFQPLGASAPVVYKSVSYNQRQVTITANVSELGAGETYAYFGLSPEHTTDRSKFTFYTNLLVAAAGNVSATITVPEFAKLSGQVRYSLGVLVSNACSHAENGSWTSFAAQGHSNNDGYTIKDSATYVWIGGTAGGAWNDPANWSSDKADCLGYPTYYATALFDSDSVVDLTETAQVGILKTANAGSAATIRAAGTPTLTVVNECRPEDGTTLAFEGPLTVAFANALRLSPASAKNSWASTVEFRNGATASVANNITVTDGSILSVSDATLTASSSIYFALNNCVTGGTLRVSGRKALVKVTNEFRASNDAKATGGRVLFDIPSGGYERAPLRYESGTAVFGGAAGSVSPPIAFSVVPGCGATRDEGEHAYGLVDWEKFLNPEKILAGEVPNPATDGLLLTATASNGPWTDRADWTAGATATFLGARIVGTAPGKPVVRDFVLLAKGEDAATFSAVVSPGEGTPEAELTGILTRKAADASDEDVETEIAFPPVTEPESTATFTLSGLLPGRNYTFGVVATSVAGGSPKTAEAGPVLFATDELSEGSENPIFESLVCTGSNVVSATFSYVGVKLGYGAAACDVMLVCSHDGFVTTNVLAASSSAMGPLVGTVSNLRPGTVYAGFLFATNDVGGSCATEPIAFRTADETMPTERVLPEGYVRVDWVGADGRQYVDLDFKPDASTSFTGDFSVQSVTSGNNQALMGGAWDWNNTWLLQNRDGTIYFNTDGRSPGKVSKDTVYTFDYLGNGTFVLSNATSTGSCSGCPTAYSRGNLFLFACGANNNCSKARLHNRLVFRRGGETVADFIPCLDPSGVPGLYDLVSESFHASGSATDLLYGPETIVEFRSLAIESVNDSGSTFAAELSRDPAVSPLAVYAVWGPDYGAEDVSAWASVQRVGDWSAGRTNVTVSVPGLGEGTRYVRFFALPLDADGTENPNAVLWSPTVFLPETPLYVDVDPILLRADCTGREAASASFDVAMLSMGAGASAYDLFAVCRHDGFVTTNRMASGRNSLGTLPIVVGGLKPDAAYEVRFVVTNDLGGTAVSDAVSFRTREEATNASQGISSPGAWSIGSWSGTYAATNSLIRGMTPSTYSNPWHENQWDTDSAATDGMIQRDYNKQGAETFGIGNDCIVSWVFDEPSTIEGIRLFTCGWNNRQQINLSAVKARLADGSVATLSPGAAKSDATCAYAFLFPTDSDFLVANAVEVIFEFGSQQNNGVHYSEIEVVGHASSTESPTIDSVLYAGTALSAALSREDDFASTALYAVFGPSYGGEAPETWAHVVRLGVWGAGETVFTARVSGLSTDDRYVRFVSVPMSSEGEELWTLAGWSRSLYPPELELDTDIHPFVAVESGEIGSTYGRFTAIVAATGYGCDSVSLWSSFGTDAANLPEPVKIADGLVLGGSIATNHVGLAPNRTYYWLLSVRNGAEGGVSNVVTSFTTQPLGIVGEGGTITRIGDETIHTFLTDGTFTIGGSVSATVLVVGGGGAGGCRGGGGGGGGFVQQSMTLGAGTYEIVVGEGGAASTDRTACHNGEDSAIRRAGVTVLRAVGGGGGASADVSYGGNGGSGGGGHYGSGQPGQGTLGQGYDGRCGRANSGGSGGGSGGGGGAGAIAPDFADGKGGGAGGPGRASSITGEEVYYGGGGGGGCEPSWVSGGAGGIGGGGAGGAGYGDAGRPGTPGTGGGGGGGGGNSNFSYLSGGAGGSGIVVIRYTGNYGDPSEVTAPIVTLEQPVIDEAGVLAFDYDVFWPGARAATCAITLEYGDREDRMPHTAVIADGVVGPQSASVPGFVPGRTYYVRLVAKNTRGIESKPTSTFRVEAPVRDEDPGEGREVEILAPLDGDPFTATLAVAEGASGGQSLRAYWGVRNAGTRAADWDGSALVADDLPAAAWTNDWSASLPADAAFLRFAVEDPSEGTVRWSETYVRSIDGNPLIGRTDATVFEGDDVRMLWDFHSVGAADDKAVLFVHYGTDPAASEVTRNYGPVAAGEGGDSFPALLPGTTYYWYLELVTPRGYADRSAVQSFTTPGCSLIEPGHPDNRNGRVVTFPFRCTEIGAGETWAILKVGPYTGSSVSSTDGNTVYELARMPISSTGSYSFTWDGTEPISANGHDFDALAYGDTIFWQIVISNELTRADYRKTCYGCGTFRVSDFRSFTWRGADGATWNDPASWSPSAEQPSDAPGYPIWGSTAVFPADASVSVPSETTVCRVLLSDSVDLELSGEGKLFVSRAPWASNMGKRTSSKVSGEWGIGTPSWVPEPILQLGSAASIRLRDGASLETGGTAAKLTLSSGQRIDVDSGSSFRSVNEFSIRDAASALVVDGGSVSVAGAVRPSASANASTGISIAGAAGSFFAEGAFAVSDASYAPGRLEFVVPAEGYAGIPLRTPIANANRFADDKGLIEISVPVDAPAATVDGEGEYRLIEWSFLGIATNRIVLATLPHPATDYWFWTYDNTSARTGDVVTGLGVYLAGGADEPTVPSIRRIRLSACTETSATVEATVSPGGTSPSAAFGYAVTPADAAEPTEWTPTGSAVESTTILSIPLADLARSTAYAVWIRGTNDVGTTVSKFDFSTLGDFAILKSWSGATSERTYGPYTILTFSDPTAPATLEVSRGGLADILLVGGGGAGGKARGYHGAGGGGGAGGFVYTNGTALLPGSYTIQVGVGGEATTDSRVRSNGEPSRLIDASGTALFTALGGGGGGSGQALAGRDGGSGGGGVGLSDGVGDSKSAGPGGHGTPGQGHDGGTNLEPPDGNDAGGSGGGGAGEPGGNADGANAGKGGDGLLCAITGDSIYYAGGGAGGPRDGSAAAGGLGGGAASRGRDYDGAAGADGFGGGGAGGAGSTSGSSRDGGPGGCGTVIIRARTAPSGPYAYIAFRSVEPGVTDAFVEFELLEMGDGAESVDLSLVWGETEDDLRYSIPVGRLSATGIAQRTVYGLRPSHRYYAKLVADNGLAGGAGETTVFSFATGPLEESGSSGGIVPGLWQGVIENVSSLDTTTNIRTRDIGAGLTNRRAELSPVAGTAAFESNSELPSTSYPDNPVKMTAKTTYAYSGFVYLSAGTTYFLLDSDETSMLSISGDGLSAPVSVSKTGSAAVFGTAVVTTPGWFPIEIRFYNGSGTGCAKTDGFLDVGGRPVAVGFTANATTYAFSLANLATMITDPWINLVDPGDGSFLRADMPTRSVTVESVSATASTVSSRLAFGNESTAASRLYMAYGPQWGGTDLESWESVGTVVDLGTIAGTVSGCEIGPVDGWGTEVFYVRFVLVNSSGESWSAPIYFEDPEAPALSGFALSNVRGDTFTVSAVLDTCGTGCETARAAVEYGHSEDFSDAVLWNLGDLSAGPFTATVFTNDLRSAFYVEPGETYFVRIVAENASGIRTSSEVLSFASTAGSKLEVDTPVVSQRNATITGRLSEVGCGTTTVLFRWSTDGGATWETREVASVADGTRPRDTEFDPIRFTTENFSDTYLWEFTCSNGCATASWTDKASGSFTTRDSATYRWKAVDGEWDGDWNDPAHWTPSATDHAGYPHFADATADFSDCPAGLPVTVYVTESVDGGSIRSTRGGQDLAFVGDDGTELTVRWNLSGEGSAYAMEGLRFNASPVYYTSFSLSRYATIEVRGGATFTVFSMETYNGAGTNRIHVAEGSVFQANGNLKLIGTGSEFVLDDSTAIVSGSLEGASNSDAHILFRGENAKLRVGSTIQNHAKFRFDIPKDGYRAVPIEPIGSPNQLDNTNQHGIRFTVLPESELFESGKCRSIALLRWGSIHPGGTPEDHFVLDAVPFAANGVNALHVFYDNEPETTDGKKFTGVSLTYKGNGGTSLLIR